MLYFILMFFSFLEAIIGISLMTASVMRFREPVKKHVTIALIVMIILISFFFGAIIKYGVDMVEVFSIMLICTVLSAWFFICSRDSFFVTVFNLLTFINIYSFTSYTSDNLVIHDSGVLNIAEYIIIRAAIFAIIVLLLFKYVRPQFHRLVEALFSEWRSAILVPLLFLVLQSVLLYYPEQYWNWEGKSLNKFIIVIVYMLFFAVYNLLYIQANAIVEKYLLEKRELLISQQNKLWESELACQKSTVELACHQRHDMHHHNAVIMGMLMNGDIDKLKGYMQEFDASIDSNNKDEYCNNSIVNSLLNAYVVMAETEGIKTEFNVVVPESIGIENVDLTCVFGNVLENALEACMRIPKEEERKIIITAKFVDNRLRLQVENTCCDDIIFDGELPITQKKGGGTGTKSISYIAERYDGMAGFSVKDGKFFAQIVLNAH